MLIIVYNVELFVYGTSKFKFTKLQNESDVMIVGWLDVISWNLNHQKVDRGVDNVYNIELF